MDQGVADFINLMILLVLIVVNDLSLEKDIEALEKRVKELEHGRADEQ